MAGPGQQDRTIRAGLAGLGQAVQGRARPGRPGRTGRAGPLVAFGPVGKERTGRVGTAGPGVQAEPGWPDRVRQVGTAGPAAASRAVPGVTGASGLGRAGRVGLEFGGGKEAGTSFGGQGGPLSPPLIFLMCSTCRPLGNMIDYVRYRLSYFYNFDNKAE